MAGSIQIGRAQSGLEALAGLDGWRGRPAKASSPIKIAVASGKGGTGKTTIATSLALSLAEEATASPLFYLDCDVEGPNGHLFLSPVLKRRQDVAIQIPRVDAAKRTACLDITELGWTTAGMGAEHRGRTGDS